MKFRFSARCPTAASGVRSLAGPSQTSSLTQIKRCERATPASPTTRWRTRAWLRLGVAVEEPPLTQLPRTSLAARCAAATNRDWYSCRNDVIAHERPGRRGAGRHDPLFVHQPAGHYSLQPSAHRARPQLRWPLPFAGRALAGGAATEAARVLNDCVQVGRGGIRSAS